MCPRTIPDPAVAGALEQAINTSGNIDFIISLV
jgi:hypothetical protein